MTKESIIKRAEKAGWEVTFSDDTVRFYSYDTDFSFEIRIKSINEIHSKVNDFFDYFDEDYVEDCDMPYDELSEYVEEINWKISELLVALEQLFVPC